MVPSGSSGSIPIVTPSSHSSKKPHVERQAMHHITLRSGFRRNEVKGGYGVDSRTAASGSDMQIAAIGAMALIPPATLG